METKHSALQKTEKKDFRVKAVIFDFDGTLFDTLDVWSEATVKLLGKYNIELTQEVYDVLDKLTLDQGIAWCIDTFQIDTTLEDLVSEYEEIIEKAYAHSVKPQKGAIEALEYLKKHNIPMVIASASKTNWIQSALENHHLSYYFQKIYSCHEYSTNKSSPFIYQKAAEDLGLCPKDIAVVEDTLYALQTAKAAGFISTAVFEPHERHKAQIEELADLYLSSLADLPKTSLIKEKE
jgi:HAD superfamily hydrolase (TIGR01509 family)